MAKKSMILKQQGPAKYSTRKYNRCKICGRPHAYLRNYGICRIAYRKNPSGTELPGKRSNSSNTTPLGLKTARRVCVSFAPCAKTEENR